MEDLKEKFEELSSEEKLNFVKEVIMPAMCEMFSENPEKMMNELKPKCKELMADKDMEMPQMMKMMGMDMSDMMGMDMEGK